MDLPTILGFHLEKQWDPVFLLLSTFLTSLNSSSKIFLASMVALDFPNIKTCLPHKLSGTEFICQACSKYNSSRRCGSASSALQYLTPCWFRLTPLKDRRLADNFPLDKFPPDNFPPDKFHLDKLQNKYMITKMYIHSPTGGFLCALRAQGWGICLVRNVHFLLCILVLDINCQQVPPGQVPLWTSSPRTTSPRTSSPTDNFPPDKFPWQASI